MNSNYEIDFTTLNWVKQELEDTLKQARQSLESYVDDPQDASLMRFCASYLHQVQGTLRMVELYGAAMVVEEMERLAQSLLDGKVRQTEEAYQILMRGMLQVPDYLDRLQSGHRDIPIVLLPLLNDLRACRGDKLLTETALFAPDLSRALPAEASGPASPLPEPVLKANAARLRMAFQLGLLKWFKGEEVSANTARMALVLDRLVAATAQVDARRLWWVGAGLLEAVRADKVESSVAVKLLVGKVDRELKQLVDLGEASFARQAPAELTRNLLYYLAQIDGAGARVEQIQALYGLRELLPSDEELEHARGVMSGANRQLLDTVGEAIKEDVLRVKDALDLYLRTGNDKVSDLEPQAEALQRVADTLGMLGLGVPRRLVLDQKETVDQIVAGKHAADESTLLDIAGALLYVESSLDDHITHLGRGGAAAPAGDGGLELPQAEVRQILEATMREAQGNVQQAKQDIVAFIESPWDHSKIEELPRLLDEITGALRMLNLPDAASLLRGITRFIDLELLKYRRVPSGDQLDLLADALASIEYYMEALRDQRGNRERILEVTQRSLEALGYWPLPEMLDDADVDAGSEAAPTATATEEFPSFGGDFMAAEAASDLQVEAPQEESEQWPSIDLPPVEPMATGLPEEPAPAAAEELPEDLQPAIEIAPGEGLEALVVGETESPPEPAATDFHGLRFSEEATASADERSDALLAAEADADAAAELPGLELGSLDALPPVAEEVPQAATPVEADNAVEADTAADIQAEPADAFSWELEAPAEAAIADEDAAVAGDSAVDVTAVDSERVDIDIDVDADAAAVGVDATASDEAAAGEPALFEAPASLDTLAESAAAADVAVPVPAVAPAVPQPPALEVPASGFQAVPSDEIDEEIREVFVEEVQDELENLNRQYPQWLADQGDFEKLKPIRRSFHTLKGSGRLVGALAIGEFSWKIENMLNRVLDKTIGVGPALLDLMDQAIAALPELLAALRGDGPPTANIGAIMWCADRLAAGEEVWLPKAEPAPTAADQTVAASEAGAASELQDSPSDEVAVELGSEVEESDLLPGESDSTELQEPAAFSDEVAEDSGDAAADAVEQQVPAGHDGEGFATDEHAEAEPDLVPATAAGPELIEAQIEEAPSTEAQPSPLEVDPVLMDILRSEVGAHLQSIRDYLAEWYSDGQGMQASEGLLRAVHTLNGAVSMVELPAIAGLVAPLEGYLKRVRGHELLVDRRAADLLSESADAIDDCMSSLERAEALPDLSALIEAAVALRDDLPVVDRGYQAFGIHMAEDAAPGPSVEDEGSASELLQQSAGEAETPLAEDQPAQADALPWYEADLGDEAVALLDELGADLPDVGASDIVLADADADADEVKAAAERPWYEADAEEALDEGEAGTVGDADSLGLLKSEDEELGAIELTEVFDAAVDLSELEAAADADDDAAAASAEAEAMPEADEPAAAIVSDADEPTTAAEAAAEEVDDSLPGADLGDIVIEADEALAQIEPGADSALVTEPWSSTIEAETGSAEEELDALLDALDVGDEEPSALDESPFALDALEEAAPDESLPGGVEDALADADLAISDSIGEASGESGVSGLSEGAQFEQTPLPELDSGSGSDSDSEPAPFSEDLLAAEQDSEFQSVLEELAVDESLSGADQADAAAQYAEPLALQLATTEASAAEGGEPPATTAAEAVGRSRIPVDSHPEAALDTSDLDTELLDIFLQEGAEILDQSDSMMAELRQSPDDRDIIAGLQRELHTLKGGARMAGVAPIGDLSHAMESLFEALADGRSQATGRQTVEVLEHAFDALHRMVQRVQQGRAINTPDQTIAVLEALQRGELPAYLDEAAPVAELPQAAAAAVAEDGEAAAEQAPAEARKLQPARPESLRRTALDDEEPGQRMAQEVIRVRADLIDNLVNFAGEVSIYRSRLEAQIGGFRFNLVEFDQTVTRLREQLRKLEMETEAQILSRYQREMEHLPGDPEFDPLELDRFSTLQQLSRALAESVSDLLSLQNLMDDIARQSETLLLQQSRVSSDLQEGLMRTRMVPFESLVPRLRRILRQTSAELGKRAQLRVEGAQGEMDRTVLERMTAPLEHMLRNALAHGLEAPADRIKAGKGEEGTIGIAVSRDATEVVIRISDDGRGMDRDAIRAKAIERGLIRDDAQLSDRDLYQFVLETGFSTATEVSKIAGRGVGMDVVNSEIRQLGGSLQIDSERSRGTTFTVRLPFTLAVTQAILIKLADAIFAVPMTSIQGVMRMSRKDFEQRQADQQTEVSYGGETYQTYDLGDLLGNPVTHGIDDGQIPLLMTRTGDQRAAIRVSSVIGSREIVVKSVGPQLSSVPGFFGATIMGDGSVVVILDLAPLVRHGAALRQAPELAAEMEAELPPPAPVRRAPLVMVVDDSITMRKVTSRVLERNELDVVTAKDGLDAVEQLQDKVPDVMLLDIEMPRMDGYELATYMKNDPRLRRVPIIMITSRTGEKHRQRALEIGVERYLGKPYQEGELLQNVREALAQGATDGVH